MPRNNEASKKATPHIVREIHVPPTPLVAETKTKQWEQQQWNILWSGGDNSEASSSADPMMSSLSRSMRELNDWKRSQCKKDPNDDGGTCLGVAQSSTTTDIIPLMPFSEWGDISHANSATAIHTINMSSIKQSKSAPRSLGRGSVSGGWKRAQHGKGARLRRKAEAEARQRRKTQADHRKKLYTHSSMPAYLTYSHICS